MKNEYIVSLIVEYFLKIIVNIFVYKTVIYLLHVIYSLRLYRILCVIIISDFLLKYLYEFYRLTSFLQRNCMCANYEFNEEVTEDTHKLKSKNDKMFLLLN